MGTTETFSLHSTLIGNFSGAGPDFDESAGQQTPCLVTLSSRFLVSTSLTASHVDLPAIAFNS